MISSTSSSSVGDLVAHALNSKRKSAHKKADVWDAVYTIKGNQASSTYKSLMSKARVADRGGYRAALPVSSIHQAGAMDYRLRPVETALPATLLEISRDSYSGASPSLRGGSVLELLRFLIEHPKAAKAVLQGGHKVLFFGDTGQASTKHVGILDIELRRFCIRRLPDHARIEGEIGEYVLFERALRRSFTRI